MRKIVDDIRIRLKQDSTSLSQYTPFLENEINKFEKNNSLSIMNYDNWIMNTQKENYLKQPIYTLHEVKNRDSANTIVAKVKWAYDIKGVIGKSKVISVFIASTNSCITAANRGGNALERARADLEPASVARRVHLGGVKPGRVAGRA